MSQALWYYVDRQEQRHGPMAAQVIRDAYRRGQLDDETLVWREGMGEWQALKRVGSELGLDDLPAMPLPSPAPDGASPYAPPSAAVARQTTNYVGGGDVVYAGFWRRWAAWVVDTFLVTMAYYVVLMIVVMGFGFGFGAFDPSSATGQLGVFQIVTMLAVYVTGPILSALYYVYQESSEAQATLGKRLFGIKVTDADGHRLGRKHALGRWASHLLCYVTIYIGYLVVAFTDRKQGLHDMAASTLVVDQWAYTSRPDLQKRELGGCLIAFIVVVFGGSVLSVIAFFAMLAALGGASWR
ncbi:RDD family protein [Arenimonas sp.]|uniref:RDD family protein n=1 Tax=Arenimonas sp. TaxID=1872635 RepID=UPI0039E480B7